jgi:hypothetical protein
MDEKISMEITQTHINTLQSIISRHANYSVNCKTWAITIFSALAVFFLEKSSNTNKCIIVFPIILFYLLDCYYLGLERMFRDIYDKFIESFNNDSLIKKDIIIDLDKKNKVLYFLKGFISFSTTPVYVLLLFFACIIIRGV